MKHRIIFKEVGSWTETSEGEHIYDRDDGLRIIRDKYKISSLGETHIEPVPIPPHVSVIEKAATPSPDSAPVDGNVRFVCYRSILVKMMIEGVGWSINAERCGGSIYLSSTKPRDPHTPEGSYGKRFEDLVTHPPKCRGCVFMRVGLIKFDGDSPIEVLCASEMDAAFRPESIGGPEDLHIDEVGISKYTDTRYFELKTVDIKSRNTTFKRLKSRSLWLQCVLGGVGSAIIAWHDKGVVKSIDTYTLDDISREGEKYWTPEKCISRGIYVLSWIRKKLKDEGKYLITHSAGGSVITIKKI